MAFYGVGFNDTSKELPEGDARSLSFRMNKEREHYYQLSVFILSAIGLWPFNITLLRRIQTVMFVILLGSATIMQFSNFKSTERSMGFVIYDLTLLLVSLGVVLKYYYFLYQSKAIRRITGQINHDWSVIENKEELRIIKRHAYYGALCIKIFALLTYPTTICMAMSSYSPILLDIILPLNDSRPIHAVLKQKIFVFEQTSVKHLYILCTNVAMLTATSIVVGTEGLSFMWLRHASGLLEITGYRIKRAFADFPIEIQDSGKSAIMQDMLIRAVHLHRNATEFINDVVKSFEPSYLVLLLLGVTSLSINLYQLSLVFPHEVRDMLISALLAAAQLSYMFILNYAVQELTDTCNNIFRQAYDTEWYEAPLKIQKVLLIFMVTTSKTFTVNICGLYVASLQGFAMISKMSMSYFTVICSTQS